MKIVYSASSLLIWGILISACNAHERKYPVDFDTAKLAAANKNPEEATMLRIMVGSRLKPNGYFFGAPGVRPNGDISIDTVRASPEYTDTGIQLYYRFLEGSTVKTDTFYFNLGPKKP